MSNRINENQVLLSICIPTNGIVEWVIKAVNSIYRQNVNESLFEVVITDNGDSNLLEKRIKKIMTFHNNLKYYKSKAEGFLNQIEAFKHSSGAMIKFLNHRYIMCQGSVEYLLEMARKYADTMPVMYFTNNSLKCKKEIRTFDCFDDFIKGMDIYSSWSGGLAIWNKKFQNMNIKEYNYYFPHTDILFAEKKADQYLVNDTLLMTEMSVGNHSKGTYNYFYCFSIEYMLILSKLFEMKVISFDTLSFLKKKMCGFLACSYIDSYFFSFYKDFDNSRRKDYIQFFFGNQFVLEVIKKAPRRIISNIIQKLRGKR